MSNRTLLTRALAGAAGVVFAVAPGSAYAGLQQPPTPNGSPSAAPTLLRADLTGENEVSVKGSPPAGEKAGRGAAMVRIRGDQVCFALHWKGIDTPTMAHIHAGAAGTNGPVEVTFFEGALPATLNGATGCTTAPAGTVANITAHPDQHYVNLHTAKHPTGALRGQLSRVDRPAGPHHGQRR